MAQLIGLDNITNILNEYLEQFELIAVPDTDFAYFYQTNEVHYSLIEMDDMGTAFLADVKGRFPHIKAPLFLWSLFHEIGHNETWDNLDNSEIALSEDIKTKAEQTHDFNLYKTAPDEWAATDWAGKYLESHEQEVRDLWENLVPAIKYFYEVNSIQEEDE